MTRKEIIRIAQGLITDFKCESETMVEFCNAVIQALEQEPKEVYNKGFADGQKALAEHLKLCKEEKEWIPVSERLPEIDVEVLVTDDAGGLATVHTDVCYRQYNNTKKRFWYASQCVTAWKPLPKPYSHEESEV